jgi:general secretion pathway protein G
MTRRLSTPCPAAYCSSTRARGGFSMIELLIVITVIAILAGLLLGGVQSAMSRVRVAGVVAELKNFEKAVKDFSSDFGVDPPSFIILCEQAADWSTVDPDIRASRAFIRQLWKDYDFTVDRDINGINGVEAEPIRLNGSECLVFFLGGLIDKGSGVAVAKGFSKVSAAPFGSLAGAQGSRSGPYYEFESKQFIDLDNDGFLEYMDSIPGQQRPIQYFSSYGGTGYRPLGRNNTYDGGTPTTSDDEVLPNSLRWVYTKSQGAPASGSTPAKAAEPFNPNGFQLISPGLNTEYCGTLASGTTYEGGGFMDPENGVKTGATYVMFSPTAVTINRDAVSAVLERDNITNFSGGEIH